LASAAVIAKLATIEFHVSSPSLNIYII